MSLVTSNQGSAIASRLVFPFRLPYHFTVGFAQSDNVRVAVMIAVDDHQVLEQDWIAAVAVRAEKTSNIFPPLQFSVIVVASNDHGPGRDVSG